MELMEAASSQPNLSSNPPPHPPPPSPPTHHNSSTPNYEAPPEDLALSKALTTPPSPPSSTSLPPPIHWTGVSRFIVPRITLEGFSPEFHWTKALEDKLSCWLRDGRKRKLLIWMMRAKKVEDSFIQQAKPFVGRGGADGVYTQTSNASIRSPSCYPQRSADSAYSSSTSSSADFAASRSPQKSDLSEEGASTLSGNHSSAQKKARVSQSVCASGKAHELESSRLLETEESDGRESSLQSKDFEARGRFPAHLSSTTRSFEANNTAATHIESCSSSSSSHSYASEDNTPSDTDDSVPSDIDGSRISYDRTLSTLSSESSCPSVEAEDALPDEYLLEAEGGAELMVRSSRGDNGGSSPVEVAATCQESHKAQRNPLGGYQKREESSSMHTKTVAGSFLSEESSSPYTKAASWGFPKDEESKSPHTPHLSVPLNLGETYSSDTKTTPSHTHSESLVFDKVKNDFFPPHPLSSAILDPEGGRHTHTALQAAESSLKSPGKTEDNAYEYSLAFDEDILAPLAEEEEFLGRCILLYKKSALKRFSFTELNKKISFLEMPYSNVLKHLLALNTRLFAPLIIHETRWTKDTHQDLVEQMHNFGSSLTDLASMVSSSPIFYLPRMDLNELKKSVGMRYLTRQLDLLLVAWINQIRRVSQATLEASIQDADSHADGPMEEINFWEKKLKVLSAALEQAESPNVRCVLEFLSSVGSLYVHTFSALMNDIKENYVVATNTLQFLKIFKKVFISLEEANPFSVRALFPEIFNVLKFLSQCSEYYGKTENFIGLQLRVIKKVMSIFEDHIIMTEIADDEKVASLMEVLKEGIQCSFSWKAFFRKYSMLEGGASSHSYENFGGGSTDAKSICGFSGNEEDVIFPRMNAFAQRCKELLFICEAQLQFKIRNELFSYLSGYNIAAIEHGFKSIHTNLVKELSHLQMVTYSVLDISATQWFENFQALKKQIGIFAGMYVSFVSISVEQSIGIEQKAVLLEVYFAYALLQQVKDGILDKFKEFVLGFVEGVKKSIENLQNINDSTSGYFNDLSSHHLSSAISLNSPASSVSSFIPISLSSAEASKAFFGPQKILLARSLVTLKKRELRAISVCAEKLSCVESVKDGKQLVGELERHLQQFEKQQFEDWLKHLPTLGLSSLGDLNAKVQLLLKDSVLKRRQHTNYVEANFDLKIMRFFGDCKDWCDLLNEEAELKPVVALVKTFEGSYMGIIKKIRKEVKSYNKLALKLTAREIKLMKGEFDVVEVLIDQGIHQVYWMAQAKAAQFADLLGVKMEEFSEKRKRFRLGASIIERISESISQKIFFTIEKGAAYSMESFVNTQRLQLNLTLADCLASITEVTSTLVTIIEGLGFEGEDEKRNELVRYISNVRLSLVNSLKKMMVNSLKNLLDVLLSSQSSEEEAIAYLTFDAELKTDGSFQLAPTIDLVFEAIHHIEEEAIKLAKSLEESLPSIEKINKRLGDSLSGESSEKKNETSEYLVYPSDCEKEASLNIQADEEINSLLKKIKSVVSKAFKKASNIYIKSWNDNYKCIICTKLRGRGEETSSSTRQIAAGNSHTHTPERTSPEESINFCLMKANSLQQEATTVNHHFIRINFELLQYLLIENCQAWNDAAFEMWFSSSSSLVLDLIKQCDEAIAFFTTTPITYDEWIVYDEQWKSGAISVKEIFKKYESLQADVKQFEGQKHLKNLMNKYSKDLQILQQRISEYKASLDNAKPALDELTDKLIEETLAQRESINRQIKIITKNFPEVAPIDVKIESSNRQSNTAALDELNKLQLATQQLRNQIFKVTPAIEKFKLTPVDSDELEVIDKDIASLRSIWNIKSYWDKIFDEAMALPFESISTDELFKSAEQPLRELLFVDTSHLPIFNFMKSQISHFLEILRIVGPLRSPVMKECHFESLWSDLGEFRPLKSFSPKEFTFRDIYKLPLAQQEDWLKRKVEAAAAEDHLEKTFNHLRDRWNREKITFYDAKDDEKNASFQASFPIPIIQPDIFAELQKSFIEISNLECNHLGFQIGPELKRLKIALVEAEKNLKLLVNILNTWKYLELFKEGDLEAPLGIAVRRRSRFVEAKGASLEILQIERELSCFLNQMKDEAGGLVISLCILASSSSGDLGSLENIYSKELEIMRNLEECIALRRKAFPRYYYLNDRNLLDAMLAEKSGSPLIEELVQHCFPGLTFIDFQVLSKPGNKVEPASSSWEIKGVKNLAEEKLIFGPKFSTFHGNLEEKIEQLEGVISRKVHDLIEGIHYHTQGNAVTYANLMEQYPLQVIILNQRMKWKGEIEIALKRMTSGRKERLSALMAHEMREIHSLLKIAKSLSNSEEDSISLKKLQGLITEHFFMRDIEEKLLRTKDDEEASFLFRSQITYERLDDKHQHSQKDTKKEAAIQVCLLGKSTPYGYEFLGDGFCGSFISPLASRAMTSLGLALRLKSKGLIIHGDHASGKTEAVKALARAFGKNLIIFKGSSVSFSSSDLKRIIDSQKYGSVWMCLKNCELVSEELYSVLQKKLKEELIKLGEDSNKLFAPLERLMTTSSSASTSDKIVESGGEAGSFESRASCSIFITLSHEEAAIPEPFEILCRVFQPVGVWKNKEKEQILEYLLQIYGFKSSSLIAEKLSSFFEACAHCNFFLRPGVAYSRSATAVDTIKSAAFLLRREQGNLSEVLAVSEALKQLVLPLISDEEMARSCLKLLSIFFQEAFVESKKNKDGRLSVRKQIEAAYEDLGLEVTTRQVDKVLQVIELKRHYQHIALIGKSYTGKSTAIKVLKLYYERLESEGQRNIELQWVYPNSLSYNSSSSFSSLGEENHTLPGSKGFNQEYEAANPPARVELYPTHTHTSHSTEEMLSECLKEQLEGETAAEEARKKVNLPTLTASSQTCMQHWLVFDGELQRSWYDPLMASINSYECSELDFISCVCVNPKTSFERKNLGFCLFFEFGDLKHAAPDMLGNIGKVFFGDECIDWNSYLMAWMKKKKNQRNPSFANFQSAIIDTTKEINEKLIEVLERKNNSYLNLRTIKLFCAFFDCLEADFTYKNGDFEDISIYCKKVVIYILLITYGNCIDRAKDTQKIVDCVLKFDRNFPSTRATLDYTLNLENGEWIPWSEEATFTDINKSNGLLGLERMFDSLLLTSEASKLLFLSKLLYKKGFPIVFFGEANVGKSMIASSLIKDETVEARRGRIDGKRESSLHKRFFFLSRHTPERFEKLLMENMKLQEKKTYIPSCGKVLTCFLEDVNLPNLKVEALADYSDIHETIRQSLENGYWQRTPLSKKKDAPKLLGLQFVATFCGSDSTNPLEMNERFYHNFHMLIVPKPTSGDLKKIYGIVCNKIFFNFKLEIRAAAEKMPAATQEVLKIFSPQTGTAGVETAISASTLDVIKLFKGLSLVTPAIYDDPGSVCKLWIHEMYRVFSDRLFTRDSRDQFSAKLREATRKYFKHEMLAPLEKPFIFSSFNRLSLHIGCAPYEQVLDSEALKKFIVLKLRDYKAWMKEEEEKLAEGRKKADFSGFCVSSTLEGRRADEAALDSLMQSFTMESAESICRVLRALSSLSQTVVLVGKQRTRISLIVKVSAFLTDFSVFNFNDFASSEGYCLVDFMKALILCAGIKKKDCVCIFNIEKHHIIEDALTDSKLKILDVATALFLLEGWSLLDYCESLSYKDLLALYDEAEVSLSKELLTREELLSDLQLEMKNHLRVALILSVEDEALDYIKKNYSVLLTHSYLGVMLEEGQEELIQACKAFFSEKEFPLDVSQLFYDLFASLKIFKHHPATKNTMQCFTEFLNSFWIFYSARGSVLKQTLEGLTYGQQKYEDTTKLLKMQEAGIEHTNERLVTTHKEFYACEVSLTHNEFELKCLTEKISAEQALLAEKELAIRKLMEEKDEILRLPAKRNDEELAALEKFSNANFSDVRTAGQPPELLLKTAIYVLKLLQKQSYAGEARLELSDVPNFVSSIIAKGKAKGSTESINIDLMQDFDEYFAGYTAGFIPDASAKERKESYQLSDLLKSWISAAKELAEAWKLLEPSLEAVALLRKESEKIEETLDAFKIKKKTLVSTLKLLSEQKLELADTKISLEDYTITTRMQQQKTEALLNNFFNVYKEYRKFFSFHTEEQKLLIGNAILSAAFASFAGPLDTSERKKMVELWKSLLIRENIKFSSSNSNSFMESFIDVKSSKHWKEFEASPLLPHQPIEAENNFILSASSHKLPLVFDPQKFFLQSLKGKFGKLIIEDINYELILSKEILPAEGIDEKIPICFTISIDCIQKAVERNFTAFIEALEKLAIVRDNEEVNAGRKQRNPRKNIFFVVFDFFTSFRIPEKLCTDFCFLNYQLDVVSLAAYLQKLAFEVDSSSNGLHINLLRDIASCRQAKVSFLNSIISSIKQSSGVFIEDQRVLADLQDFKLYLKDKKSKRQVNTRDLRILENEYESYSLLGHRAAIIFLVLFELSATFPNISFSLLSYKLWFKDNIIAHQNLASKGEEFADYMASLISFHTKDICRRSRFFLFKNQKLLFLAKLSIKISLENHRVSSEEVRLLEESLEREKLLLPCVLSREDDALPDWITDRATWELMNRFEKIVKINCFRSEFYKASSTWSSWYHMKAPEREELPGEFEKLLSRFQKLLLLIILRPDRASFTLKIFISDTIDPQLIAAQPSHELYDTLRRIRQRQRPQLQIYAMENTHKEKKLLRKQSLEHEMKMLNALKKGRESYVPSSESQRQLALVDEIWQTSGTNKIVCSTLCNPLNYNMGAILNTISRSKPETEATVSSSELPPTPLVLILNGSEAKSIHCEFEESSLLIAAHQPDSLKNFVLAVFKLAESYIKFPAERQNVEKIKSADLQLLVLILFHAMLLEIQAHDKDFLGIDENIRFKATDILSTCRVFGMIEKIPTDSVMCRAFVVEKLLGGSFCSFEKVSLLSCCYEAAAEQITKIALTYNRNTSGFKMKPLRQHLQAVLIRAAVEISKNGIGQVSPSSGRIFIEDFLRYKESTEERELGVEPIEQLLTSLSGTLEFLRKFFPKEKALINENVELIEYADFYSIEETDTKSTILNLSLSKEVCVKNATLKKIWASLDGLRQGISADKTYLEDLKYLKDNRVPPSWRLELENTHSSEEAVTLDECMSINEWVLEFKKAFDYFKAIQQSNLAPTSCWLGAYTFPELFLIGSVCAYGRAISVSVENIAIQCKFSKKRSNEAPIPQDRAVQASAYAHQTSQNSLIQIVNLYLWGFSWNAEAGRLEELPAYLQYSSLPPALLSLVPFKNSPSYASEASRVACPVYKNCRRGRKGGRLKKEENPLFTIQFECLKKLPELENKLKGIHAFLHLP